MIRIMHRLGAGLIVIASFALVGCSTPSAAPGDAARVAADRATSRPANETVVVDLGSDLGRLEARTTAMHRPGTAPPDELLQPLRPIVGDAPPLLVTLGDVVKFDGRHPGDKGNWTKWDKGVAELVRKHTGRPVYWEIWNEPDQRAGFKGSQSASFSVWVHTARLIRSLDPRAVLVGPSTSKYTWVQEFLKVAKEFDVLPDVVAWHEETYRSDWVNHITGASEGFWQDGTSRERILVTQRSSNAHKYAPGDPVIYLAGIQQAHRDNAFRGVEERWGLKLSHLVTKELQPRAVYWVYAVYAGMVGQNAVKVSGGRTIDGVATVGPDGAVSVLLGRHRGRNPTTLPSSAVLGTASLTVKGLSGSAVRVSGRQVANTGDKAADEPAVALDSVVPVSRGEAKIPLPVIASGEAIVLTVTPTGADSTAIQAQ